MVHGPFSNLLLPDRAFSFFLTKYTKSYFAPLSLPIPTEYAWILFPFSLTPQIHSYSLFSMSRALCLGTTRQDYEPRILPNIQVDHNKFLLEYEMDCADLLVLRIYTFYCPIRWLYENLDN